MDSCFNPTGNIMMPSQISLNLSIDLTIHFCSFREYKYNCYVLFALFAIAKTCSPLSLNEQGKEIELHQSLIYRFLQLLL